MILVTGGAGSGKSAFAEAEAKKYSQVLYLATAIAFDEEMREKIRRHQQSRPSSWETYEGYINLAKTIQERKNHYDCFLLDCVTVLITNLLFFFGGDRDPDVWNYKILENKILQEVSAIADAAKQCGSEFIFVTGEVGMGIVPENKLSRHFREIAGRANQLLAQKADAVYLVVSGIPVQIKNQINHV